MKHIPNFITSLNLAAGFIAIIFAGNGDLVTASWLIVGAMIFDFLDGFTARLLKAYSDVGKELDSLADIVSFGVAPALIIYHLLNDSLATAAPIMVSSNGLLLTIVLISPVIMPVCSAIRLAIFNLDSTQTKTFRGLPTPANALAVVSVIIAGQNTHSELFHSFTSSPFLLIIFTFILSLLMVSRIPLLSLKVTNLKFRGNEGRYILILLILAAFATFGILAAPLIIPLYIVASALSLMF
jgi:CDP-diacylglycerol---serine O-phosphatidyltransferase